MGRHNSYNAGAETSGVTEVTGSVIVSNLPAVQTVTGSVILGELPIQVTGTVALDNFPLVQEITGSVVIVEQPVNVFGTFFQATQPITGSVIIGEQPIEATGSLHAFGDFYPAVTVVTGVVGLEGGEITVGNFPAVQEITGSAFVFGDFYPAVTEVTGTVALEGGEITVGNFPNTQSVVFSQPIETFGTQSVVVSNLPAVQTITGSVVIGEQPVNVQGTFWQSEQPVSVSNFPVIQEITGSAFVFGDFYPTSQTIDGTINVGNFPTTSSVVFPLAPTANLSSYTASTVSVELAAANPNRKALSFYISSSSDVEPVCYVAFGGLAASPINASFILYGNDYFETPGPFLTPAVQAVFNLTTGSVRIYVTELD